VKSPLLISGRKNHVVSLILLAKYKETKLAVFGMFSFPMKEVILLFSARVLKQVT
jgi:hypothetical protein